MQNLRDKLLKAGLVTEKQAQEAARDHRQGSAKNHREREKVVSEEEKQRQAAFAAREAELAEERRKESAKQAEARMQSERARRLRQLVETHRIREAGEVAFHYVRRNGKVGRLDVSLQTQQKLEQGAAAVVDDPGSPDCAVVDGDAAQRIYQVDPQAIRFWYGPEKPIGFSDAGEAGA
jgi:uncharacterized protein YaiL (DUF2058 family)